MRVRLGAPAPPAASAAPELGARTEKETFRAALQSASQRLQYSRHAQQRIERRELALDTQREARLESAVRSAAAKGARQTVVLVDELAFVVDIRQRTVITALNHREGGAERVFTNVDSVVIA